MSNNSYFNVSTTTPDYCRSPYEFGIAQVLITHVSLGIALLGVPANLLSLIVLLKGIRYRSPTNLVLIALSIEDILIIILYSLYYIAIHYAEFYKCVWLGKLRYVDSMLFFFVNWSKMIEIYTVVLLSLERYAAIRWPLKAVTLCSIGRTKRGLFSIVVISGIFKLPNLILDYRILKWDDSCQDYRLKAVFCNAIWYDTFKLVHVQLLDQICSFVIPLSLLVFLNLSLIMRINKSVKLHTDIATVKELAKSSAHMFSSDLSKGNSYFENKSFLKPEDSLRKYRFTNKLSGHNKPKPFEKECASDISNNSCLLNRQNNSNLHRPNLVSKMFTSKNVLSQSNSKSISLILVGVVSTFIICETPTTICFLFETWNLITDLGSKATTSYGNETKIMKTAFYISPGDVYYYAYPAALVLVLIGCASNFFIYILIGRKFRHDCANLILGLSSDCFKKKKNLHVSTVISNSILANSFRLRKDVQMGLGRELILAQTGDFKTTYVDTRPQLVTEVMVN